MTMEVNNSVLVPAFGPVAGVTTANGTVARLGILKGYTHFRCCTSDISYKFDGAGSAIPVTAGLVTALTKGMTFQGIYLLEVM